MCCLFLFAPQLFAADTKTPVEIFTEDQTSIAITKDKPQFVIKLKSNPTTGYAWFLREYDAQLVTPVKHVFESPKEKKVLGASGFELWTFRMKETSFKVPQQTMIRFVYARPLETDQSKQVVFRVSTR
jgi:inhibitor of cysteine peptidase